MIKVNIIEHYMQLYQVKITIVNWADVIFKLLLNSILHLSVFLKKTLIWYKYKYLNEKTILDISTANDRIIGSSWKVEIVHPLIFK